MIRFGDFAGLGRVSVRIYLEVPDDTREWITEIQVGFIR